MMFYEAEAAADWHVDGKLRSRHALLWLTKEEETSSPGTDTKLGLNWVLAVFMIHHD